MDYNFFLQNLGTMTQEFREEGVKIVESIPKGMNTINFRYHPGLSSFHSSKIEPDHPLHEYSRRCAELVKDWIDPAKLQEFDLNTLEPGGFIGDHTDMTGGRGAGWSIPQSHKVHFVLQGDRSITTHRRSPKYIPQSSVMKQGEIYLYNNYVVHTVSNKGTTPRIHLILIYMDPRWEEKIKIYDKLGITSYFY